MQSLRLILLAISLGLAGGCASSPSGTDAKKVADAIGTISPSRKDTCETLKQIAEQSSRIDTIKQGKEVVYKAPPCEAKS